MFFGPAMNRGSWFERSIFVFGYSTGVFAIGFILLRIVDPENRSKTLNDTAFAAPFNSGRDVCVVDGTDDALKWQPLEVYRHLSGNHGSMHHRKYRI